VRRLFSAKGELHADREAQQEDGRLVATEEAGTRTRWQHRQMASRAH